MPKTEHPKTRILSVSYDELLLRMRHMILKNEGYTVVSTYGLKSSLKQCQKGGFDLFVLGHSIPHGDKRNMVEAFRQSCPGQVISLTRGASEPFLDGADFHIEPDPERLVRLIAEINSKESQSGLKR
jgi:CheY-like chemotaxis protein